MATGRAWGEAAAIEADVPRFESGCYQFTILRPAQELPPLRLFRLEGGTTDLSALRGKPILLNFWASWCAACRTELPALDRLYRDAWRGRVHVVAVSEDRGPRETVARFVNSLDLKALPIFLDPNGYVAHSDADNAKKAPFALYGIADHPTWSRARARSSATCRATPIGPPRRRMISLPIWAGRRLLEALQAF